MQTIISVSTGLDMRRISWKTLNRLFAAMSLVVLGAGLFVAWNIPTWLAKPDGSNDSIANTPKRITADPSEKESLSEESIQRALTISLRRMNPPIPLPPSETTQATPPPPAPTVLFPGQLAGTIVDPESSKSYALLRFPDGVVKLIGVKQPLSESAPDTIVDEIALDSVIIRSGDRTQTVSIPSTP